jgi:hypothetical protein
MLRTLVLEMPRVAGRALVVAPCRCPTANLVHHFGASICAPRRDQDVRPRAGRVECCDAAHALACADDQHDLPVETPRLRSSPATVR